MRGNKHSSEPCGPPHPRRHFLKTLLVTGAVSGGGWERLWIAELDAAPASRACRVRLRLDDFPALKSDFGSVRLGTSALVANVPRGLFYPILINRAPGPVFHALDAECSHAGCAVRPSTTASGTMTCPCHGSVYAIDGRRLLGPASFPLTAYPTVFDGAGTLDIELPPEWVAISSSRLEPASTTRFAIQFLAFAQLTYEIRYRPSFADAWSRVSFALTPEGASDRLTWAGNDDFVTVYVDRIGPSGFYAVTLALQPV